MKPQQALRPDLAIIAEWIEPGARVLDLGCGDGTLLSHLHDTRQVRGYGLEIDPDNVAACISAGVNVIQADLDEGLQTFETGSFDYVVMTQALQVVQRPDILVEEILRIGRRGVVTFPNFAHWRNRLQLGLAGFMPVTRAIPNEWYSTPNIHFCTVRDFERLCMDKHVRMLRRSMVNHAHHRSLVMRLRPNLLAEIAIYELAPKQAAQSSRDG